VAMRTMIRFALLPDVWLAALGPDDSLDDFK
jgi:hypothetical protein